MAGASPTARTCGCGAMARACARSAGSSAASGSRPRARPSSSYGRSRAMTGPWARRRACWHRPRRRSRSSPATLSRRSWRSAMPTDSFSSCASRTAPRSWRASPAPCRSRRSPGARPATCSLSEPRTGRRESSISDSAAVRVFWLFLLRRRGAGTWRRGASSRRRIHRVVGQPVPDLAAAKERYAEIAADLELLAVGAHLHERAIDRSVARVHDGPVLVGQALSVHSFDQREAQHRCSPLGALALVADPVRILAGLEEDFDDGALVDAIPLGDAEPAFGLAGVLVDLFPEAHGRWLARRGGGHDRSRCDRNAHDDQLLQQRSHHTLHDPV